MSVVGELRQLREARPDAALFHSVHRSRFARTKYRAAALPSGCIGESDRNFQPGPGKRRRRVGTGRVRRVRVLVYILG